MLDAKAGIRVYAAVSEPALAPAILIELPVHARSRGPGQLSSRAFTVQSAEFPGLAAGRTGVMVALCDPHCEDLFTLLAEELGLAVLAATSAIEAAAALGRVTRPMRSTTSHIDRASRWWPLAETNFHEGSRWRASR